VYAHIRTAPNGVLSKLVWQLLDLQLISGITDDAVYNTSFSVEPHQWKES
jgi:hypothetical protein